jgi:aryl-alcohol dehydrogenase-like predicted oxidoreductase/adenylate kinase family enzyme
MIGLGCMRLSTSRDRNDERGVAVIRVALDAGITLLDTADSYARDEADRGHNERLIARAITEWGGDRSQLTIATKGGLRRPGSEWVPDGRAKHLREACDASRRALGQDTIDLYQLHVVDPKTPLATSVRALAKLKDDGWVRDVGLCNVTVSQIREAQSIVPIFSVQVSLGPLDGESLRNGVAEYCRDNGIRLIAYRPLGGDRRKSLARDVVLRTVSDRHNATPEGIALAWLLTFGDHVVPLPGATRVETVASIVRSRDVRLTDHDRDALDAKFSGRLLRVPRDRRRPVADKDGEVVIVMGMPGAGKTTFARELEATGYKRINRDEVGGTLADLVPRLDEVLQADTCRVVLDNTYPSRGSRNEVIETAWRHGVGVRCIWLRTPLGDAQINAIRRMIDVHGSLPSPEEIRQRSKKDTRYLLPDAQFRYERLLEEPTTDEGFEVVEIRTSRPGSDSNLPVLRLHDGSGAGDSNLTPNSSKGDSNLTPANRALILDLDQLTSDTSLLESVARYRSEGWLVFVHAWRPQIARGEMTAASVEQDVYQLKRALGEIDWAYCPHEAGPPICWCRKPIPGPLIEFAIKRNVALERAIIVGSSAAERTMAERVGARYESAL